MVQRQITVDGAAWTVSLVGRFTVYERDEYPVLFERIGPHGRRERRLSRFSPQGSRSRALALGELTDDRLAVLFRQSQPSSTSPELGYAHS